MLKPTVEKLEYLLTLHYMGIPPGDGWGSYLKNDEKSLYFYSIPKFEDSDGMTTVYRLFFDLKEGNVEWIKVKRKNGEENAIQSVFAGNGKPKFTHHGSTRRSPHSYADGNIPR